ncbi:ABC transporter permease [Ancylobacter sp. FA202]|uniref:ABC transporter permease n=1 Tax=Ancylobacter sp. FA202 TaxID=1111106 RepID=UPI00036CF896|nr:ABC transporter permease [Ancylobacter sp. FA202]
MSETKVQKFRSRIGRFEAIGIIAALAVMCTVLALASENFASSYNLAVVLRQASFVGIIALGQTLVLLIGGIDLSVGAAAGLSAIIGGMLLVHLGVDPWLVIPLTCLFGFALGTINGVLVAYARLNPFIVTLAAWEMFAGTTLVITGGSPIRPLGTEFQQFGLGTPFGIPVPVLVFAVIALVLAFVLNRTTFGRNIYAIGGNRQAAVLVGIPVKRVEMLVFGLSGSLAALAGILYASRMDSAQPSVGEGWLMPSITAAIIGGVSLRGGQGTVTGTVTGALLMAVLANGIVLLDISSYWQRVIVGAVVLLAILIDLIRRRR